MCYNEEKKKADLRKGLQNPSVSGDFSGGTDVFGSVALKLDEKTLQFVLNFLFLDAKMLKVIESYLFYLISL